MNSSQSDEPHSTPAKHSSPFNMSLQVSKAARQEKRFQDYNERCTFHHQARVRRRERAGSVGRSEGGWVRS